MKQEAQCKQFLCTKPTYWNPNDTWSDANKSYYVRQGNIVILSIATSQATPNQDTVLLYLPIGYRPIKMECMEMHDSYAFFLLSEVIAEPNGKVSTHSQHQYVTGVMSFYTEDPFPIADL